MEASPSYLRPAAILAGSLGVIQSLIWIGLSITGIVAYYCNMDFDGVSASMGSITGLTLFQLYFRSTHCTPDNLPTIDFGIFTGLSLMRSVDIHAWVWIYLMISFFWFISSCTLLSHVKSKYIRWVNLFLYFWIAITLAISVLDLVLGILFGLDYEKVMHAANSTPLLPVAAAQSQHLLIAGQAAIGTLFSVVLRGYIMWLINVVLVVFLFTQTLLVSDYNRLAPFRRAAGNANGTSANGGQANAAFVEEVQQQRKPHPIEAYGIKDTANLWYSPPSPTPPAADTNGRGPLHHSRSVFEERKQFYNSAARSSVPRVIAAGNGTANSLNDMNDVQYRQKKVVNELNQRQSQMPPDAGNGLAIGGRYVVPEPDYSPPMPRVNPFDGRRQQARTGF